jgi:hypothetical protein
MHKHEFFRILILSLCCTVAGLAQAPTKRVQPTARGTARLVCDRDCFIRVDSRPPFRLSLGLSHDVPLPEGAHTVRVATTDGGGYRELQFAVARGELKTVHCGLAQAESSLIEQTKALHQTREQIRRIEDATDQNRKRGSGATQQRGCCFAGGGRNGREGPWGGVQRIVAKINELDGQYKAYSEAAEKLYAEGSSMKLQADTQDSSNVVGAIAGIAGNVGAVRLFNDSRRNRLRAHAALRRMDQLTATLSRASDSGFDSIPEDAGASVIFDVRRNKVAGSLLAADNRIRYTEQPTSAQGKKPPKNMSFEASCGDLKSVKTDGLPILRDIDELLGTAYAISIRTKSSKITLRPVSADWMDVLGSIYLACPSRDF